MFWHRATALVNLTQHAKVQHPGAVDLSARRAISYNFFESTAIPNNYPPTLAESLPRHIGRFHGKTQVKAGGRHIHLCSVVLLNHEEDGPGPLFGVSIVGDRKTHLAPLKKEALVLESERGRHSRAPIETPQLERSHHMDDAHCP